MIRAAEPWFAYLRRQVENHAALDEPTTLGLLDIADAVQEAAEPLSRLKLNHSQACPFLFDGGCACGVKEIERLVVLAREAANSHPRGDE